MTDGIYSDWKVQEDVLMGEGIPIRLKAGFEQALHGSNYQPVLFLATRINQGVDYLFICRQPDSGKKHFVKMIIHADLPEDGGKFSFVSAEKIV